ncbi:homeodomain-interacting protein kinase 2-like isoform X3 [Xyrichtys novacula]|uniref:Homeodomain-interacting protein kinase 2-like isoform X3 n=1 Tax=Xyrichtys novacula TaxID=13765 RepID=A0AAV1GLX9_XYRNO|nr:homeodomain-interacting protein kinase 2-like isoform X3 [Xyrichtys novacula]
MALDSNKTYELPKKYTYLKDLGEGSFGVVVQCLNTDTNKTVAIKIPKVKLLHDSEMKSMRMLMRRGLNRHNIVTFHESFSTMNGEALVFENLGIDIDSYIDEVVRGPMMLSDIRTITVQTPKEYWGINVKDRLRRQFTSLDDLQKEGMNTHEPQQFKQCMKLIKAMLNLSQYNRITPCDVLRHPFITQENQTKTRASTSVRPLDFNPSAAPLVDLIAQTKVSMVQPASPENTMQLTPLEFNPSAAPSVDLITPTKVIMVQPASPENTSQLEDTEREVSRSGAIDCDMQLRCRQQIWSD